MINPVGRGFGGGAPFTPPVNRGFGGGAPPFAPPVNGGFGGGTPMPPRTGIGGPLPDNPMMPARPVLGTMHKGGIIKKTGLYNMKKGEKVTPSKGKLTTKERNALPKSSFVFPKTRKYPLNDANHARNALSRAAHQGGSVESKVRAAVHRKYPSIGHKMVSVSALSS